MIAAQEESDMTAINLSTMRTASTEALSRPGADIPDAQSAAAAILIARDGRHARIRRDGRVSEARVAFSCLSRPEAGDLVLTTAADGMDWIIAVLERHSEAPAQLWADGDLTIASASAGIALTAAREVSIDAGERARIAAPEIALHAGIARFVLDELLQVGRRLNLYVTKIRSVGEMAETFAEHVLTRAKRGSRFIEGSDQLRAGDIDHRAEGTLQLRAETAFITADTVVRLDAKQIHMG
jgi:hypothetical protein